ncbi:LysE family translocator [Porphyromonas sp. COT-239 OH1446]|uniref:LysE family translocator n=1 Tax=Porphyromonas sp. COT-239 OH1446 TaxID=1515613 RepID=UPI00052D04AB|nr:LysE family transporter [Porphyromonas sp. COT-239 OH1446]KGN68346.1 hypothetical protein HQ37_06040 [Porphyromonas sp. COT-239 OH1446]
MIETILKGIIIGIFVSAPMGPVGLLCLRETMYNGRRDGLLTGIGATISDLLYALMAYWGVSLVLDFVSKYDAVLRLVGGVIIVIFGYVLFLNSGAPIKRAASRRLGKLHGLRKVVIAFFVTLSNPFILLLFLPLYTRFDFVQSAESSPLGILGAMTSIVAGCLIWWLGLTYAVSHIATRMGQTPVKWIARTIAIVLMVIGLYGLASGIQYYL